MTAPDLTPDPSKPYPVNDRTGADDEAWLSELRRIEDEPDAPESLRERVARAMFFADADWMTPAQFDAGWTIAARRDRDLALADAALAVIRGQS